MLGRRSPSGVAALVADSFHQPAPVAILVTLAVVALALDAVDGWVARRSGTASALGARFDGEVDAFLILVLSVYVARSAGAWVLAIGAARYAFLAAGWLLPWMREPLPPRYWRKVVAATQGIVLTIAAADVLPLRSDPSRPRRRACPACRVVRPRRLVAVDAAGTLTTSDPARVRAQIAAVLTILAVLLAWAALVAPDQPSRLTPSAFMRVPVEGLVLIALALVLPATARRLLAWIVGPALGLVVIVKILNFGFFTTFDRPFDPVGDWSYAGIGIETMRDSIGGTAANVALVGAAVLCAAFFVLTTLAVLRLTKVAAAHRRWSLQTVAALGVVWVLCWAFGAQLVSGAPVASASAAGLAVDEVRAVQAGLEDNEIFADEIRHDRFRNTPGSQLLTGLHGKDVILAFVESYGKGRGPGLLFLATGRCCSRQGYEATAGRRLLLPERLPHLVDVRRRQLAGALHHAFGSLGQQPTAVLPARQDRPLHTQQGVQAGRVADRR